MANRQAFVGLAIAIMGVSATILLAEASAGSSLRDLDVDVSQSALVHRSDVLPVFFRSVTFLGSAWFLAPITILAVALLTLTRRFAMACLVAAAMTTSLVLTVTIKTTVGRGRPDPDDVVGAINTGFAFPSGHTLNSTVFLGLTAVLLLTVIHARRARLLLLVTAVVLAALIGLSRIYLGYHWLSDVLAGWASGVAVLGLCWMLAAWWRGGLQPFGRESTRVGHTGPHA